MTRRRCSALTDAVSAMADAPAAAPRATLGQQVQGITGLFHPALAADTPGPEYAWALGTLLDELLVHHGHEVISAIDLGWRHFPSTTLAEAPEVAAVSVLSAVMIPPARLAGPAEVTVRFSQAPGQELTVAEAVSRPAAPFARHYDAVVHFELPPVPADGAWELTFDVGDRFRGTGYLPVPTRLSYRRGEAILRSRDGAEAGRLSDDIRYWDKRYAASDWASRDSWSPETAAAFAADLGRAWARRLLQDLGADAGPADLAAKLAARATTA